MNNHNVFQIRKRYTQGDPISAYLFIIVLEIVFTVIKSNQNIDKLRIFEHDFLYTASSDDTIFFAGIRKILKVFDKFSKISGLKPNKSKCETAAIGALKEV